jgi:hypothetical protein
MAQVVEQLSSKTKALSSNPSNHPKKERKEEIMLATMQRMVCLSRDTRWETVEVLKQEKNGDLDCGGGISGGGHKRTIPLSLHS